MIAVRFAVDIGHRCSTAFDIIRVSLIGIYFGHFPDR